MRERKKWTKGRKKGINMEHDKDNKVERKEEYIK